MLVRELPGGKALTDRYPGFSELPLGRAAVFSMRLLVEGSLWSAISSQNQISAQLSEHVTGLDLQANDTIVQVGANDGKRDDPIHGILTTSDTKALLVEPHPTAFKALQALHYERPNTQLANTAISASGGDVTLFTPIITGSELHTSVWTCNSKEQAKQEIKRSMGRKALRQCDVVELKLNTQTADDLLDEFSVDPGDVAVLVCDAEGQDIGIINSFLDAGAEPQVIFFEQLHTTEEPTNALKTRLKTMGYTLVESKKDVLATRSVDQNA